MREVVDETQACGSGAVAAVAVGRLNYNLAERVTVRLLGGDLEVYWLEYNKPIWLIGPAHFVMKPTYYRVFFCNFSKKYLQL